MTTNQYCKLSGCLQRTKCRFMYTVLGTTLAKAALKVSMTRSSWQVLGPFKHRRDLETGLGSINFSRVNVLHVLNPGMVSDSIALL